MKGMCVAHGGARKCEFEYGCEKNAKKTRDYALLMEEMASASIQVAVRRLRKTGNVLSTWRRTEEVYAYQRL